METRKKVEACGRSALSEESNFLTRRRRKFGSRIARYPLHISVYRRQQINSNRVILPCTAKNFPYTAMRTARPGNESVLRNALADRAAPRCASLNERFFSLVNNKLEQKLLCNYICKCRVINSRGKRHREIRNIEASGARPGGNALNLSSRRMHCRIQPPVHCSDCIAGTTIAHAKVIAHWRPEWKLAGIINEKWVPLALTEEI